MRDGGASLDRSSFSGTLSDDNGEESPADLTINKRNRHKAHIYTHTHNFSSGCLGDNGRFGRRECKINVC